MATVYGFSEEIRNLNAETFTFTADGTFTFTFEDIYGNKGTAIAKVDWIDKEKPVITLNGDATITLEYASTYNELGAIATDNKDPEIGTKLVIAGTVNTSIPGTYTITYNATDWATNIATQITRTVIVNEIPCIDTDGDGYGIVGKDQ